jgi:hypothetical protein
MEEILKYMFPEAAPGDWRLQDDGAGPYIVQWNRAEPKPTSEDVAAATPAAQAALVASEKDAMLTTGRTMRDTVLYRLNGIQIDALLANDTATVSAISTAKQQLKDITIWPAVVAAVDAETTKTAFLSRYYDIAMQLQLASLYAVSAFRELDV